MERNGAAATANPSWEELLGSNDWSGLLSPLLPALRNHLLRCGSFCQITADSFISDSHSRYLGKCRYSHASLLCQVFFKETANYVVPNIDGYLYTNILLETNWMGYVAVSSDNLYEETNRREIYVVWRGTSRPLEVVEDFNTDPVPFGDEGDVKIMRGWRDIYTSSNPIGTHPSAQEHLRAVIQAYLTNYKDQNPSIICVGHSLGGSLAIVSAFDIASSVLSQKEFDGKDIPVCAVAFDAPKVGNQAFNDALEKLPNTKVLRINNHKDIVTYWPLCSEYVDTGIILQIDSDKSAFLKSNQDYGEDWLGKISQRHALQVILHTVTGWITEFDNDSELVKARLPLVNRSGGYLKAKHKVIEAWWVEKNKGMVYNAEKDVWSEREVPWN